MNIAHPLNAIPEGWPIWLTFIILLALTAIFGRLTKQDLKTTESPLNAISLEFAAFQKSKAQRIVKAWTNENKLDLARKHLFWDSFFILAYSTLLALGCVMTARVLHQPQTDAYSLALFVAWLPWLAGLLDFIENYAIWKMLYGFEGEGLPWLATAPATLKFIIGIGTGIYTLFGLGYRLLK